jgi:hypothetical protein
MKEPVDHTAISALIEAHREEFSTLMSANEQRREWLEKKAALSGKKPTSTRRL